MSVSEFQLNPYQPPLAQLAPRAIRAMGRAPSELGEIVSYRRRLLFREWRFCGGDVLVWDARGSVEFVAWNGDRIAKQFSWLYTPQFSFELPTRRGTVPCTIDVRIGYFFAVRCMRLLVAGETRFIEGLPALLDVNE